VERIWTRRFLLLVVMNVFMVLPYCMLTPTFPMHLAGLNLDTGSAGLVIGLFMLSATAFRPLAGSVADRFPLTRLYGVGTVLMAAGMAGYALTSSLVLLMVFRILHGFGWSLATTTVATQVNRSLPESRLSQGIGFFGLSVTIALAFGPALGLGLQRASGLAGVLGAGGACLLAGLVLWAMQGREGRSRVTIDAVIPRRPFRIEGVERTAVRPAILAMLFGLGTASIATYLALHALQRGVAGVEIAFAIQAVALFVIRPSAGRLADRKGHGIVLIPSMIVLIGALVLTAIVHDTVLLFVAALLAGAGSGAATASCQSLAIAKVAPIRRGLANSTFYLGLDFGFGVRRGPRRKGRRLDRVRCHVPAVHPAASGGAGPVVPLPSEASASGGTSRPGLRLPPAWHIVEERVRSGPGGKPCGRLSDSRSVRSSVVSSPHSS
jgi:MFS family permease